MTVGTDLDLGWVTRELTRFEVWARVVNDNGLRTVAEVGVYRGEFARALLYGCPQISTYYMLDPWRHLDEWNKPLNIDDDKFEACYREALERTEAHADKRVVLRGTTIESSDGIPDDSLDFAYVDGDHTLRGITIDLVRIWPKVRSGGLLAGDDFFRSMWHHEEEFEPTLVFPMAVHFAEAVGAPVYALPRNQFVIHKVRGHRFVDLTGRYDSTALRNAMRPRRGGKKRGPAN